MSPRGLCSTLLVLLICYAPGHTHALSREVDSASRCTPCCVPLGALSRALSTACAVPAIAALPEMTQACALAAALAVSPLDLDKVLAPPRLTAHESKVGSERVSSSRFPSPLALTAERDHPDQAAGAGLPMAGLSQVPDANPLTGRSDLKGDHQHLEQTSSLGVAEAAKQHNRRLGRRAAPVCTESIRALTLESLQAHCAVSGCHWSGTASDTEEYLDLSDLWFKKDLTLACVDATAVGVPYNHTTCPARAQPCTVGIQLGLKVAGNSPHSLAKAATLLGIWQGSASVSLRGPWGAERLSTVLQHADRIEELEANSVGLSSVDSKVLAAFTHLRCLALKENNMRSIEAAAFSLLTALAKVSLLGNQLRALPFQLFHNCTKLVYIDLTRNVLHILDAAVFRGLSALQTINLGDNQLSSLSASLFQGLSALSILSIQGNKLEDIAVNTFVGLAALDTLDVSENQLARLHQGVFSHLSSMVTLYVDHNRIVTVDDDALVGLVSLEILHLHNNQLDTLPSRVFRDLRKLNTLRLDGNRLANVDNTWLEGLSTLRLLDLSSNTLSRLPNGLLFLPQLSSLSQLWLRYTGISKLELPANTSLAYLTLEGSRHLAHVQLHSGATAQVADITQTALRTADIECQLLGYEALVARTMPHTSSLALLQKCMVGVNRRFLDVSDNGEYRLQAVQDTLAGHAANFLKGNATWLLYPHLEPVRIEAVELILYASPVQCSTTLGRQYMFIEKANGLVFQEEPLQEFSCSCIPGYYADNYGNCRKRIPFAATPGGTATVIVTTLLAAGLCVLSLGRVKRRLQRANFDLEMQRGLLHYAETQVLALKRVWEIESEEVTLLRRIDGDGEGAFGAVWQGDWDGMMVAVKVMLAGLLEQDSGLAAEFDREAEFLMQARHANVVRFFGAGRMQEGQPFMVLELVSRGSLRGLVRGERAMTLDAAVKRRLALDVTRGMAYIHALGALHRDLKSGNVLVTENWRGKVADFGSMRTLLAVAASESRSRAGAVGGLKRPPATQLYSARDSTLTAGVGTPLYMSPEVIRGDDYGEAADVWAFGIMVWELVEQRAPDLLEELGEQTRGPFLGRLLQLLEAGLRLQVGLGAPAWAARILVECTAAEPSDRPSFLALQNRLLVVDEAGQAEGVE